jgi:signal transduction histidine kinase
MSGKVTLVQETNTDIQQGWLYYLPIFKDDNSDRSSNHNEAKNCRGDLEGFVYAAFRASDLMNGILDEQDKEIKFEIYDSSELAKEHLLFDSDELCHLDGNTATTHTSMLPLSIRGRVWTLYFESRPGLVETSGSNQGLAVAVGGLAFDFLLFLVIASIGRQKRRAVEIANEMTEDVRASEDLIRKILVNASEAILTIDENGHVALANRIARQMFEFPDNSQITFDDYLSSQSWSYLVGKFNQTSDSRYKCTVEASRGKELDAFVCRLSMGSFVVSKKQFHILVARDETARIESDRKLAQINNELVIASKTAAKVELANGVLHNVGNIVNSINVSTNVIKKQIEQTSVSNLEKVCQLITEHETDFVGFVQSDSRGKKLPRYLQKVSEALVDENQKLEKELQDLTKNVTHMKGVIKSQQSDAKSHSTLNALSPKELLDDALTANKANLANHDVELILKVDDRLDEVYSDKHTILQILVNLIKNANESVVENQTANPQIVIRANSDNRNVIFSVADNGVGISPSKIGQIFDHGFSTKQSGHGFGLHSSAKAATDLGGELTVSSPGIGSGATFKLSIPITNQSNANELVASKHANAAL